HAVNRGGNAGFFDFCGKTVKTARENLAGKPPHQIHVAWQFSVAACRCPRAGIQRVERAPRTAAANAARERDDHCNTAKKFHRTGKTTMKPNACRSKVTR